jgi:fructokinase
VSVPALRLGIDLGGTKIEIAALDASGAIAHRQRIATPRQDYAGTVAAVTGLVTAAEAALGRHGTVGIGIPGTISAASGTVKNANSTWLNGRPLQHDLARALGREVRLANDANCFALSEAIDGAGAGAAVVFGIIMGTGTGGGLVVHGRVVEGANGIAGEWGHNPLPWPEDDERPGPACYCGRAGCIETFLSGPGLARDYRASARVPHPVGVEEIVRWAADGEPEARACLARHERRAARAIASLINVVDPEVIVIGGGLSHLESLYTAVPAQWGPFVFSDRVDTRVVRARHGDASGVRGAAWLWGGPGPDGRAS